MKNSKKVLTLTARMAFVEDSMQLGHTDSELPMRHPSGDRDVRLGVSSTEL